MLGNRSNARSEVLPRRGSLTRSYVWGWASKSKQQQQPKTNSRQMLVNCGHPCHKLLIFKVFWGRHGKLVAHFKKNKTIKCSSYLCVLLLQMMSPQGGMWACVWSPRPGLSVGRASRCHLAAVPSPLQRTSCGIQSPAGGLRCLYEKDELGGAGRGQSSTVMCNEVTRWEQNNKSFEFEVIFFISYLFLFSV